MTGSEVYLTLPEVAELLRVPVKTLRDWRLKGQGPRVYKVVGQLRYRRAEVEAWVDEQCVTPTPAVVPARGRRRSA